MREICGMTRDAQADLLNDEHGALKPPLYPMRRINARAQVCCSLLRVFAT
jgi:hypothetical protein